MEFEPILKTKRSGRCNYNMDPFPLLKADKKYAGVYTGISVEIVKKEDVIEIYENGCYGKGNRSRGAPLVVKDQSGEVTIPDDGYPETLTLNLVEGLFLSHFLKVLVIKDTKGNDVDWNEYLELSKDMDEGFVEKVACYLYLKSKGWIVKSGVKYGGTFLIYKKNPRLYHASAVVYIRSHSLFSRFWPRELKGIHRVAEAAHKDILILELEFPEDFTSNTIDDIKRIRISETIIRRFNQKLYLQQQNNKKNRH